MTAKNLWCRDLKKTSFNSRTYKLCQFENSTINAVQKSLKQRFGNAAFFRVQTVDVLSVVAYIVTSMFALVWMSLMASLSPNKQHCEKQTLFRTWRTNYNYIAWGEEGWESV